MAALTVEITAGTETTARREFDRDSVSIGRAADNDLVLEGEHVAPAHARIFRGLDGFLVERLGGHRAWLVRGSERVVLAEPLELEPGDELEIGGQEADGTRLRVSFSAEPSSTQIVELRPLGELGKDLGGPDDASLRLRALLEAQRALGACEDLESVVTVLADAALALVPRATHASVALYENAAEPQATALATVVTRVRGADGRPTAPAGPLPLTRSVLLKVVRERAAVLAVDARDETFSSESMLGANIQSTIGVPLWKGNDILGVLQVDSRAAPAMFGARDVDALGVLAADASLAVAHARAIAKLLLAEQRLERENAFLKSRERARSGKLAIIGKSHAMSELLKQLDQVVDTRVSVLVEGETGTGKELIASALHDRSRRREKLFVAQNCAAFSEQLLESELFGHKRGAFTGATEEKKGLFEVADGGTLFLDEIGEMPLALQAKLLRVLQDGEVRPVGSTQVKRVNVRIVAATNRKLEDEVAAGRFRRDLYYRLKVFPIEVPPLRERREDIAALAGHFLALHSREMGKPVAGLAQETLAALAAHDWPGNVRELSNEVQRLVIRARPGAFVTPAELSPSVRRAGALVEQTGATAGTLKDRVEQVERFILLEVLREHENNKTSAAKALGMTREGLHKKLKQLGVG